MTVHCDLFVGNFFCLAPLCVLTCRTVFLLHFEYWGRRELQLADGVSQPGVQAKIMVKNSYRSREDVHSKTEGWLAKCQQAGCW